MHKVLILGAGKIGALISGLLGDSGDFDVQIADANKDAAQAVAAKHDLDNVRPFAIDATDKAALTAHVTEHRPAAVICDMRGQRCFVCRVNRKRSHVVEIMLGSNRLSSVLIRV
ncbi:MAG: saccharopine dehydrogenase NADP-binding domain-containing protein, partial [Pseudomonadota bacterium]